MRPYSNDYFKDLDVLFNEIKSNNNNPIIVSNKIIEVLNNEIYDLYIWLSNYNFPSPEEEIQFFKEQKPIIISKLIYYTKIVNIECNLPTAKEFKTKFLKKEIDKISQYSKDNSFFNQYYRSGSTHNDLKYFTRNRNKNFNYYECHIINYDISVSTSHDFNVAQILANDLIIFYLEDKLEYLNGNPRQNPNAIALNWTGSRIELIELLYALQTQKVINNGSIEMKEFATTFGQLFNIELEETIYRSYYDIKHRKSGRTKFLNALSETFNNRMENDEM